MLMSSIQKDEMEELKKQLEIGAIQNAYRAILAFMMRLRTYYANKYGDPFVSNLYQGYMDMTYFAIHPASLKPLDLKVAIVFNYNAFRFEAWLAARNRKIQRQYRALFNGSHWPEYRIVAPGEGIDSIIECDLAKEFDLDHPDELIKNIENKTDEFLETIEKFLSNLHSGAG
jgi:hypothetical protein